MTSSTTLAPEVLAYINGVAGTGATQKKNAEAWQRYSILPYTMRDVREISIDTRILGRRLPSPVIAAPWAGQGHAHPDGEWATARAATKAGVTVCLSSGSSQSVESVAEFSGPFIQQIYLPSDRTVITPFLERSVEAGAFALALTVDNPSTGKQLGFRSGLSALPPQKSQNFPDVTDRSALASAADLSVRDIEWLRETTGLPVLVKGVLRSEDAVRAVEAGAAGVIVSNHSGRQLDGVVATAEVLPEIVDALAHTDATVLVDGGIRSGADVLRALALGAKAVLIGRPIARALAEGGEEAIATVLTDLVEDLEFALAMAGVPNTADLSRDLLRLSAPTIPS